MLHDKHGNGMDSVRIQELRLRGAGGVFLPSAAMLNTPCAAEKKTDKKFYYRGGREVCCFCGVERELHL